MSKGDDSPTIGGKSAEIPSVDISEPDPGSENYRLGREIARGGMGYIFEAEDRKLGRIVAAKAVSFQSDSDRGTKERFVREAAVLARLEHPNIVPIHDIIWEDGSPEFYTMKLVNGRTLQDILNELREGKGTNSREFTLDRLLLIFRKVCDAIAFAHSKNVIHRDLKPENIMVGEFGEVLVMDWGIAKVLGEITPGVAATPQGKNFDPGATLEGTVMGTPHYMSPEQAAGRIDELDILTDIYSLGAILYTILTLRAPVQGATLEEVLENVVSGRIMPPKGHSVVQGGGLSKPAEIPSALAAVALQALNHGKSERYQTVEALAGDIEKYQGGFATGAERAGFGTQLKLLIRRNKGIFSTAFAAWLLITGLAVWFVFNLQSKEQRAVEGELAARTALAKSSLSLAEAALREGNGIAMQEALDEVPENLRDSTWRYLYDQSDTSIATLDTGNYQVCGVEPHPALPGVFVFVDKGGVVTVRNVLTGERLLEIGNLGGRRHYNIAVSPDGKRVAIGPYGAKPSEDGIKIHDLHTGEKIGGWPAGGTASLAFSPDGKTLAQSESRSTTSHLWNAETGERLWSINASERADGVAFTPDGRYVVMQASIHPPWFVNAKTGIRDFIIDAKVVDTSTLSPDGDRVVGGHRNGLVRGWSVKARTGVFEHRTDGRPISHILFSRTGSKYATVASLSDRRIAIRIWDAATGSPLESLVGGIGAYGGAAVHPLTGELVVCGTETKVWAFDDPPKWTVRGERAPGTFKFWGSETLVTVPWSWENKVRFAEVTESENRPVWTTGIPFDCFSISADHTTAVAAFRFSNDPIVLLRKKGAESIGTVRVDSPGAIREIRINPSATRVALSRVLQKEVAIIGIPGGEQEIIPHSELDIHDVKDVVWLDDDRLLLLAVCGAERGAPESSERLIVWSSPEKRILQSEIQTAQMDRVISEPGGARFAEAGPDKRIRIRDAETLEILNAFRAHDGPITALAWHPSAPVLASGSEDLTIRFWDVDKPRRIDEIRGPILPANSLDFSPGGRLIGCATQDGLVRAWNLDFLSDERHPPAEEPPAPEKNLEINADGWTDLFFDSPQRSDHGWQKLPDGGIRSPASKYSSYPFPGDFADTSYHLRATIRRSGLKKPNALVFTLPVGEYDVGFFLDSFPDDGFFTGLGHIKSKSIKKSPGVVRGMQVDDLAPHRLELTVLIDGPEATIEVGLDDRPLFAWTGPAEDLRRNRDWPSPPGAVSVGSTNDNWEVLSAQMKRVDD